MSPATWFYALIFISSLALLVYMGWRFFSNYRVVSKGQKAIFFAVLFFIVGGLLGSLQSMLGLEGTFRWGYPSYSIAILCLIVYATEPWQNQKKRWGKDPFAPKGPYDH